MGQWVASNHNNADEYLGSSFPFLHHYETVSNTVLKLSLPYGSRHITIINNGSNAVRVGFTVNGVNSNPNPNFFVVKGGLASPRLEIKCKELYFLRDGSSDATDVSVIVGYTNIPPKNVPLLTGSTGFSGVG
mgnify:FL=1